MKRSMRVRCGLACMGVASMVLITACGGGSSGGAETLDGQIQILNNTPVFIERIEVGPAGDPAPKTDRLQGSLLSGSSFSIGVAGGVYDVDVWIFGQPFGYVQRHRDVMVTPGAIHTIVVVPGAIP